jgi:hypothetical protein
MSDAITLMGLSGLMRQAIKLIKGITLTQDDVSFSMAVFSVLSWFKVSRNINPNSAMLHLCVEVNVRGCNAAATCICKGEEGPVCW